MTVVMLTVLFYGVGTQRHTSVLCVCCKSKSKWASNKIIFCGVLLTGKLTVFAGVGIVVSELSFQTHVSLNTIVKLHEALKANPPTALNQQELTSSMY